MTGRVRVACAVLLVGILAPVAATASSQDLFGVGARAIAMAGAVVSNTEGFEAVYYNPANLMLVDSNRFTLGYQRADFNITLNDDDYDIDAASNLVIGVNVPIPLGGVLENRLALGLGFVLPTASVLRAEIPAPEEPFFALIEHRPQVVGVHAGLGIRFTDWLYAGGGVVALAELLGSLDVAPNLTGSLGTVVRDELVADYAPIFGLLLTPTPWFSVGVAYHGVSESRFSFPITADLGPQFPIEVPLLNVSGIAQYDPRHIAVDMTFRPLPQLVLAVGLSFKKWGDFQNPLQNTTEPVPEQDPPHFEDTITPRLGVEYTLIGEETTWDFRFGGFVENSPVPEQTGNANFLDSDRFALGLGVGWAWRGLTIDAAVQFQFMADRNHEKEAEEVRDPENAGLPEIDHGGSILVSVLEMGLSF